MLLAQTRLGNFSYCSKQQRMKKWLKRDRKERKETRRRKGTKRKQQTKRGTTNKLHTENVAKTKYGTGLELFHLEARLLFPCSVRLPFFSLLDFLLFSSSSLFCDNVSFFNFPSVLYTNVLSSYSILNNINKEETKEESKKESKQNKNKTKWNTAINGNYVFGGKRYGSLLPIDQL